MKVWELMEALAKCPAGADVWVSAGEEHEAYEAHRLIFNDDPDAEPILVGRAAEDEA